MVVKYGRAKVGKSLNPGANWIQVLKKTNCFPVFKKTNCFPVFKKTNCSTPLSGFITEFTVTLGTL